jgi:hypothetical protein
MTASAAMQQEGVRSVAITLSPFSVTPVMIDGDVTFDLIFTVANIEPGVAGAEIYLGYDPAFVGLPTTPGVAPAEVLPNFFGTSNVSINEVLPAAQCPGGVSPCIHLVLAGSPQITQTGIAARFHFRGIGQGSACFTVLESNLVDADGFSVDHTSAPQQCVDVVYRITKGITSRQGLADSANPGGGSQGCSVVTANRAGVFDWVYTDIQGEFSFANLAIGTYTFTGSYPGYLDAEKVDVSIPGNLPVIDLGTTQLRGGDVNGDKAINILDIGKIVSMFGQADVAVGSADPTSCGGRDEATDINDDGNVNISDLAITAGNWGRTGPTAWQP